MVSLPTIHIWAARLLAVLMVATLVFVVSGTLSDVEAAGKASKLFGTKEITLMRKSSDKIVATRI